MLAIAGSNGLKFYWVTNLNLFFKNRFKKIPRAAPGTSDDDLMS